MESRYKWHDFDPIDLRTRPEDLAYVQMTYADGRQFSAIHYNGMFAHAGVVPESTRVLKVRWRYITHQ
jgi:hypothetical protein